jgi:hypothetical protein
LRTRSSFCAWWYLTTRNGEIQAGEWLFPAVVLADLDFEPINAGDLFVLTHLVGDIFTRYAGGLPPETAGLGSGFRLGFLQLQHPNQRICQKHRHAPSNVKKIRNRIFEPTFIYVSQILPQIFLTLLGRSWNCWYSSLSLRKEGDFVM